MYLGEDFPLNHALYFCRDFRNTHFVGPSETKSTSSQTEEQQQVAVQGGVGVGADTGSNNRQSINVTTDDPEEIEAALSTVNNAVNDTAAVSIQAENIAATEVTTAAGTYAQESELQSEETAAALEEAQSIAANAAPQTQAAQNEITSGSSPLASVAGTSISTSTVLVLLALAGLLIGIFIKAKK